MTKPKPKPPSTTSIELDRLRASVIAHLKRKGPMQEESIARSIGLNYRTNKRSERDAKLTPLLEVMVADGDIQVLQPSATFPYVRYALQGDGRQSAWQKL